MTTEFSFEEVTEKDIRKCALWIQKKLNLQNWTFRLYTEDAIPRWVEESTYDVVGQCKAAPTKLAARVWIPIGKLRLQDMNPLQCVIHEFFHILHSSLGLDEVEGKIDIDESLCCRMEGIVFELYCLETGRMLPKRHTTETWYREVPSLQ